MNKFWNVPNMLTILRLLLVPALLLCFFLIPGEDHLVAMIIFIVASLTDVLDGLIARKTNQITPYGVVLDPLADKLLKISTLVAFCIVGIIPIWLVSILVFIDVGMIITGMCLYKKKITIPSNIFGKTGTFIMSIGLLMCFFDGSLHPWNLVVLYVGLILIVISLIVYILLNYKRVFKIKPKGEKQGEQDKQKKQTDEVQVVETTATPVQETEEKTEISTTKDNNVSGAN